MTAHLTAAVVTGATGFIGAALARRLARSGTRTLCVVRNGNTHAARLLGVSGVERVSLSSFDSPALRAALLDVRPEVVFHLASYGVHQGNRNPKEMAAGNVTLMEQLLSAVAGLPLRRFVSTGSCTQYGPVAEPERLSESHPIAPTSPYGVAKAEAERRGSMIAREYGTPFVPLRLFGVYGLGEAGDRLVPYLMDCLRQGEAPILTGGEQARDLTYVDDAVEALVQAATADGVVPHTVYNVCSGEPTRVRTVAKVVADRMGTPGADLGLGRRPYRTDETMWIVGDGRRFRAATGWQPTIGLSEGIGRVVDHTLEKAGT